MVKNSFRKSLCLMRQAFIAHTFYQRCRLFFFCFVSLIFALRSYCESAHKYAYTCILIIAREWLWPSPMKREITAFGITRLPITSRHPLEKRVKQATHKQMHMDATNQPDHNRSKRCAQICACKAKKKLRLQCERRHILTQIYKHSIKLQSTS